MKVLEVLTGKITLRQFVREALTEVSPPGWEGTVQHMKKHGKISNPWALAWWMKGHGDRSHVKPPKKG